MQWVQKTGNKITIEVTQNTLTILDLVLSYADHMDKYIRDVEMENVLILHQKIINAFNLQTSNLRLTLSRNELSNLFSILLAAESDLLPEYEALEDKINIVCNEIKVICINVSSLEKSRNKLH